MKKSSATLKTVSSKAKALASTLAGKITLGALALLALYSLTDNRVTPTTDPEMGRTSVKIVRNDGRSGGTGVILASGKSESIILTNRHVCGVVKNGGLVVTDTDSFAVTSYTASQENDLCIVTVAADLGINTKIAAQAPGKYTQAAISGHPRLLPNIVTRGHFSGKEVIEIMTGMRACTEADLDSPNAFFCLLLGGVPEIQRFEAQVVSATIQPGSSGSAVFNSKGEISGLVFAGSGDLGYAHIVPYEAVINFLYREARNLPRQYPSNAIDFSTASAEKKLREVCSFTEIEAKIQPICDLLERDVVWKN